MNERTNKLTTKGQTLVQELEKLKLQNKQTEIRARNASEEQMRVAQFEQDKTVAERDAARVEMRLLADEGRMRENELAMLNSRVKETEEEISKKEGKENKLKTDRAEARQAADRATIEKMNYERKVKELEQKVERSRKETDIEMERNKQLSQQRTGVS
jgi:hypothetical protein